MVNTYGNLPGVNTTTIGGNDDFIGQSRLAQSEYKNAGTMLYGHNIVYGTDAISCTVCEEEMEIPEIVAGSSAFNQVLYQFYLTAFFKEMRCEPTYERKGHNHPIDDTYIPPDNIPPTGGDVYYSGDVSDVTVTNGSTITVAGDQWTHTNNNEWTNMSTGGTATSFELSKLSMESRDAIGDNESDDSDDSKESLKSRIANTILR